jgi:hypothetical protein
MALGVVDDAAALQRHNDRLACRAAAGYRRLAPVQAAVVLSTRVMVSTRGTGARMPAGRANLVA